MDRKSFLLCVLAYVLWGVLVLYWHLLNHVQPLIVLSNRIVWSAVFGWMLLRKNGGVPAFRSALHNRFFIPSTILIVLNWWVYILAVNHEIVIEISLGNFMTPLMDFALGMLFLKEKATRLDWLALLFAALGVVAPILAYGKFPWIALANTVIFSSYGLVKKKMPEIDGTVGATVETTLAAPVFLAVILFSKAGAVTAAALDLRTALLLVFAGPMTFLPLMLYGKGVKSIPLSTAGFTHYLCPILNTLLSVTVLGERFSKELIIAYSFVLTALVLYSISLIRKDRVLHRMSE